MYKALKAHRSLSKEAGKLMYRCDPGLGTFFLLPWWLSCKGSQDRNPAATLPSLF